MTRALLISDLSYVRFAAVKNSWCNDFWKGGGHLIKFWWFMIWSIFVLVHLTSITARWPWGLWIFWRRCDSRNFLSDSFLSFRQRGLTKLFWCKELLVDHWLLGIGYAYGNRGLFIVLITDHGFDNSINSHLFSHSNATVGVGKEPLMRLLVPSKVRQRRWNTSWLLFLALGSWTSMAKEGEWHL